MKDQAAKKSPRQATLTRNTLETQIQLKLDLDGQGVSRINTPVPFLNHMLESFSKHSRFDLEVQAEGDIEIDYHHTVEDVGLVLGEALLQAVGEKRGMNRYGAATLPMDEVLTTVAVDFCNRPYLVYKTESLPPGRIGNFDVELIREWFQALANTARLNLHVVVHYGQNRHHIVESMFKALARALAAATRVDPNILAIPSTKGSL